MEEEEVFCMTQIVNVEKEIKGGVMTEQLYYFGEWVAMEDGEYDEARKYLELWSKFFQRKHSSLKLVQDIWVYHPKGLPIATLRDFGEISQRGTLAIKLEMIGVKPSGLKDLSERLYEALDDDRSH